MLAEWWSQFGCNKEIAATHVEQSHETIGKTKTGRLKFNNIGCREPLGFPTDGNVSVINPLGKFILVVDWIKEISGSFAIGVHA